MQTQQCVLALCGSQSDDLAAGTIGHQSNFLAARIDGTENRPQKPGNQGNVGSDHHELRHELLTTLNELGDRHGFHTSGTPGCADLRRLYDVVWMKNELGELLDVPLVAALEFSPEFQLVEEGFYKLVIVRSQHRVMVFKGINEQTIEKHVERLTAMIRSFAATRKGDRYLFLGFCNFDKDVKAEVWTAE